ncbi:MAG: ABC transporter substrate-binding protein [Neomegalonema sp.]|nr:ABC transporter substrate-binding protein [Neomegalonema sp.]
MRLCTDNPPACWARALLLACLIALLPLTARSQDREPPSAAAQVEPLVIAVMTSTAPGSKRQTAAAIAAYTRWQAAKINATGGVRGRPLEMRYFDDANDIEKTAANVDEALKTPNLLGIIGVWSSTRGAAVVERIGVSGVPFISEISRQELIEGHPNIFSMVRAASTDLPSFVDFVSSKGSVAYFGIKGDLFTQQFEDTLRRLEREGAVEVSAWEWIDPEIGVTEEVAAAALGRIEDQRPEALIFAIGSARGGAMLKSLHEGDIVLPVYAASGSMLRMKSALGSERYQGEMFQTRASLPGVINSRLAALLQDRDFVAAGGDFGSNARSYGASYADTVAVMAEAANDGGGQRGSGSSLDEIRQDTVAGLAKTSSGARIFRGATRDWNFDPGGSAIEPVYLLRSPPGSRRLELHDRQITASNGALKQIPIVYLSIDLVQVNAIDSNAETFDAVFYVGLETSAPLTLDAFEFTNAVLSEAGAMPILSIRRLQNTAGAKMQIYKVTGRFQFDPDLTRYPFDRQSFSIELQPADTATEIIVQPPLKSQRDRVFDIPGWQPLSGGNGEYIGAEQDLIRVVIDQARNPRIIAFQRYSFTWLADRQSLDYALRVVLPLSLILLVAYLSVFIPQARFESAISLQVTALLSTIALYLAIPKVSNDTATLSDQTFVFAEAVIVLMTGLSILRINCQSLLGGYLARSLGVFQIISFPLLALLWLRYIDAVGSGSSDTIAGKSLSQAIAVLQGVL